MGNLAHHIMLAIINFDTSCSSVLVYCTALCKTGFLLSTFVKLSLTDAEKYRIR